LDATPRPAPIRLLVADDHAVVRTGIAGLVEAAPDMTVVAQADNGHDAVQAWQLLRPDLALMDLQMRGFDGIDAIRAIRALEAQARILVLTACGDDAQAARALQAGARGVLLKTMIRADLLCAIRAVHAGADFTPHGR
jgi:DNA-binding NarL/FixJ family response regulator